MKRLAMLILLLLSFLSLTFCGRNIVSEEKLVYAPYFPAFMGNYGDDLILQMEDRLYYVDRQTGELSVWCKREKCSHGLGAQTCPAVLPQGTVMGCDQGKIYQINAPDTARPLYYVISEVDPERGDRRELTGFVDMVEPYWASIYNGFYYYISDYIMEDDGSGQALTMSRVSLADGAEPELLWRTTDDVSFPMLTGRQFYDHYLLMTVSYTDGKALTVYNLENNEVVIDASGEMSGAFMHLGRLYYVSRHQRAVEVYDTEAQATVDTISMEGRITGDMTVAGDEDYLYITEYFTNAEDGRTCTNMYIYTYDGDHVNTVAAGPNSEDRNITYLFSTDTYIYVGRPNHYWPEADGIYAVSKNQIGQGDTPELVAVYGR